MEYIIAKSIDGKRVGEGHSPIDVINTKEKIGIDIMCLCCNSSMTNEKSIMQNFKDCGNNLDILFKENKLQEAIYLYKKSYYNKLIKAIKKYELSKLYYLVLISYSSNIYLSAFTLDINAICNIKENGLSVGNKSINCKNFIHNTFGSTKLYKSKKRLELRFSKNILTNYNTIKIY